MDIPILSRPLKVIFSVIPNFHSNSSYCAETITRRQTEIISEQSSTIALLKERRDVEHYHRMMRRARVISACVFA